jgi:hypothetical protein
VSKLLEELGLKIAPDRKDKAFIRGASKSDIAYMKDQFGSKGKQLNDLTGGAELTQKQRELLDKALEENLKARSNKWLSNRNNYKPLAQTIVTKIIKNAQDESDKNIDHATKTFGSSGTKFNQLKAAANLNARQKSIFDQKLQQAIQKDPRAKAGTMSEDDLKALAEEAADVTDKLSKTPLPDNVNELAAKSATLKDNLVELQNNGWTIKLGVKKGNFANRGTKTITMDPDSTLDPRDVVQDLAHETGHAGFTPPSDPPINDGSTPTAVKGLAYIRKVVENKLLDEGQAQIVACKTAKEFEAAGEQDIWIPGMQSDQFKAVYEKMLANTLTEAEGRKEMAILMGKEETGTSEENYIIYYAKKPLKDWNQLNPGAQVKNEDIAKLTVFK